MDRLRVEQVLRDLKESRLTLGEAMERLRTLPYDDLGFAKVDTHRSLRRGFPEAVYCPGKSDAQIAEILGRLTEDSDIVLATRASPETYEEVRKTLPGKRVAYDTLARMIVVGEVPTERGGLVLVLTAGTSDEAVAQEAAVTAETMGARVERIFDVGVAGVHRILEHRERLARARVLVVVAGMEGALASVTSGLVARPVIAVPTSVGYGASFDGLAALLAMLNACSPGVAVVNIDNGYGAGYLAAVINSP